MLNGLGKPEEIAAQGKGCRRVRGEGYVFGRRHVKARNHPSMIKDAQREHGRLDILVNNAGIQFVAPIQNFPTEKWDAIFAINLWSALYSRTSAARND